MNPELIAIVLGVIQGLTEFLPVSSSGHLEIGKVVLGYDFDAKKSMLMTVNLHLATALSTVLVYRKDIAEIVRGLCQFRWNEETKFTAKILLSMIPAVVVGLVFEKQIESLFDQNMLLVGTMLLVTGGLLLLAGKARNTNRQVEYGSAFGVGLAQAFAILPGVSRSGATISTSVLAGIDREKAAKFSFLMVIPLILGKVAKDLVTGEALEIDGTQWLPLTLGFVAAFLTGYAACRWMIQLVKKCQLWWFSIYCFIVGGVAIIYGLLN